MSMNHKSHHCADDLSLFLQDCREAVIEEWVNRLHTQAGRQYAQRARSEIMGTVSEAFAANYHVLVYNDYAPIDRFIKKITQLRLASGFSLSGVQKAFELFREIMVPQLACNLSAQQFAASILRVNDCLAYTIHRFSDYFQDMHEKTIREHNLRLEKQVAERTAALIDAERMATIGQITTSLSHEIRNPLSAVKMNLQILKKNLHLNGNDQRRLEISLGQVNRLEIILKELLDFVKPLHIQANPCDVNHVLASAIELLEIRFEDKGIHLFKSLDSFVPPMNADSEKLRQAFINLLLNALEASEPGSRVGISSKYVRYADKPFVHICVEDEGHGVTWEQISQIFEPFFTTKSRGTGLGLTNTRRIVAAHGGKVEVLIKEPRGASFNIWLPATAGPTTRVEGTEA